MQKFKMILKKIKYYRVISLLLCVILLLVGLALKSVMTHGAQKYEDQTAAKRWDSEGKFAHISIFVKESENITTDIISQMNYDLEKELAVNGVEEEDEEDTKKLYIECYSAKTQVYLSSEKKSVSVDAYAVGGDFFFFHPVKLLSGMYFSGEDLMHDGIILDEETAWNLFGSYDIVGQQIEMGDTVLFVKGVYQREDDKIFSYARGNNAEIFIPYELVSYEGLGPSITTIEFVMPNLVDNFAAELINDCFRTSEGACAMTENSKRYTVENLWKVYKSRKYRSMDNSDIILPYWEKIARYEEDVLAPKAVWMCICFISSGTIFVCLVMYELAYLTRFRNKDDIDRGI